MLLQITHYQDGTKRTKHTPNVADIQVTEAWYGIGSLPPNHHVPSVLGPVTRGRISICHWPADERADRPAYEHWDDKAMHSWEAFKASGMQDLK